MGKCVTWFFSLLLLGETEKQYSFFFLLCFLIQGLTCDIVQAGLELMTVLLPASIFGVLVLQACAPIPGPRVIVLTYGHQRGGHKEQ